MKKLVYLGILAVLALMVSCSDSNNYRNVVPQSAKVIMRMDGQAFLSQTGIDKDKFTQDCKDIFSDELEALDFEECDGINHDKPVYGFVDESVLSCGSAGLVACVSDRAALESSLEKIDELEKDDVEGITVYSFKQFNEVLIGVSDEAILVLGPAYDDAKKLRKQLVAMLKGEVKDNDPMDNPLFKRAEESGSFLALYADLSVVPDAAWNMLRQNAGNSTPMGEKAIDNIQTMTYGIDFTAGEKIINANVWATSSDEEVQKMIDDQKKYVRKVDDASLGLFADKSLFGFAANINGEELVNFLDTQMDEMREQMGEMAPMLDNIMAIIKTVNGNVLFAFDNPETSECGFVARTNGDINAISSSLEGLGLSLPATTQDGKIFFTEGDAQVCIDDEQATIINGSAISSRINGTSTLYAPLLAQIQEHSFSFFFNIESCLDIVKEAGAMDKDGERIVKAFKEVFDNVHFFTITF